MRHRKSGKHLNRTSSHRKAMFRNMAVSLIEHEIIKTTVAKAKELRPYAERLITLAKRGDLHARRLVARKISDRDVRGRLFDEIAPGFARRPGGYTRILKLRHRRGDAAEMALIELVEALEEELAERSAGFRIEDEDLEDLRTVRDAVDYVVAKLG